MPEYTKKGAVFGIAFFIAGLDGGGTQKVVVNLANALVNLSNHPGRFILRVRRIAKMSPARVN